MTAAYSLRTDGGADEPMPTCLKPGLFAVACRGIVENFEGHDAHQVLDWLVTGLLCSLGYGEGMEIFIQAVKGVHYDAGRMVDANAAAQPKEQP